ncbi:MAG TPA: hypothetical protein VFD05_03210 [Bacilli bacterium]|nr:hypothetical protein [Bacilli bacterium]
MKKTRKILLLFGMAGLLFNATSCQKGAPKMPKVQGKEVTYNPLELERKIDRLTFKNKADSFLDIYHHASVYVLEEEGVNEMNLTNKNVIDTKNDDLWLDLDYDYTELDGQLSASISGYESKNYTYFDLEYDTNQQFDYEWYNLDLYNGQYKMKKETSAFGNQYNTLYDILYDLDIPILELDMEEAKYIFDEDLILDLHELGYDKLKLYENEAMFTIEMKISLTDLTTGKDDIADAIKRGFYLGGELDYLQKFDVHYVFIFERNTLIEVGLKQLVEIEQTLEPSGFVEQSVSDGTLIMRYTDKAPKEINYGEYILIEELEEILK